LKHRPSKQRTVAVVTVGRSDYGIFQPLLARIQRSRRLRLRVMVTGMHLVPEFGNTQAMVSQDGWDDLERIPMLAASDEPVGTGLSMGLGVEGFSRAFAARKPDVLVVLGDRFETFAAVAAAAPFNIPVVHLHGGELSEGAMDDGLRHAITKLSHLHCVSTADYHRRVIQMGEAPWRVLLTGALSLDDLESIPAWPVRKLENRFAIVLRPPPLLVTYHPVTHEEDQAETQAQQLFQALAQSGLPVVFTLPNADARGRMIIAKIHQFIASRPNAWLVPNFGREAYFNMLKRAAAMVGNSSSALLEAPSFGLPAVNVGNRQKGRVRGSNVIDVPAEAGAIAAGIKQAVDPAFRRQCRLCPNPYQQGNAAQMIVDLLENLPPTQPLLNKTFYDLPAQADAAGQRA
jgi:UDP-N-acetylglucosamine 2-epimerase (non-hydrolysing)/GDP/UDP-N,N'-diacetylbacillosamine 2-epimerase (hydrolysing)